MAWYKEWFGQEYLELYAHRNAAEATRHLDFVGRVLGDSCSGRVLDLACGAGRHTAELRQRGYQTFGIDLSLTLLAHPPRVPSSAADMRALPFADGAFQWVLNFFTSFGYFERERQNFQVLEEIVRVLEPKGRFMIDFLNRERVLAQLKERDSQQEGERQIEIERWYDAATRRINKRIRIEQPGRAPQSFLESVRAYTEQEVTIGLRWAGLEVDALYGNFDGGPFHHDSERLIIVGHRAH